jgi:hypothetical protein
MLENGKGVPGADRSCEIISFVVLAVLSALSHFWYILIVFCMALLLRELVSFACQYLMASIPLVPWHAWKNSNSNLGAAHIRHQVFKPSKIS